MSSPPIAELSQASKTEQALHALAPFPAAYREHVSEEVQVLQNGEIAVEVEPLSHVADAPLDRSRLPDSVVA